MVETLPVADEPDEDIKLTELLSKYRGQQCEDCHQYFILSIEKGSRVRKSEPVS